MHSIGDFAERLINEQVGNIREGKEVPPSHSGRSTPAGKDISKVTVPDTFMKEILGESYHPQDTPPVEEIPEIVWTDPAEEVVTEKPHSITEETAQQLVPLLEEVRNLLKEMTTTGMMGVNMAGPQASGESWEKMEKSYGYKSPKSPGVSRKKVLKSAISARLKKRK